MPLFGARPPIEDRERQWIEKMLTWCVEQFGHEALEAEVLTPTPSFFPGSYQGTPDDVLNVVDLVRAHLRIDPSHIAVVLYDGQPPAHAGRPAPPTPTPPSGSATDGDPSPVEGAGPSPTAGSGPVGHSGPAASSDRPVGIGGRPAAGSRQSIAGHYSIRDGVGVIAVGMDNAPDPRRVVAVAAHELCHHKLLYQGLASADEGDHEPLTDLATVFFGLGIFTANAAFTFSQGSGGWRRQQLGYINQPMFGYALARFAWLRGDRNPAWTQYLDTNPRGYFKRAMRYLEKDPPPR